jgi:hypothetical protein
MSYSSNIIQNRIDEIKKNIKELPTPNNCFEKKRNIEEECKDECVISELKMLLNQIEVAEKEGIV